MSYTHSNQQTWQKCCYPAFISVSHGDFHAFTWWLSKGALKGGHLNICLTIFFLQSVISEIHRLWESSFFPKRLKFDADFKDGDKIQQNVFTFLDKCIRIIFCNFQILQREYLSPAVIVLTKSRKSSNINKKRKFLSQSPSEIQDNLIKAFYRDFTSFWDALTSWW